MRVRVRNSRIDGGGRQKGSVYLMDQKLPVDVPRVRDVESPIRRFPWRHTDHCRGPERWMRTTTLSHRPSGSGSAGTQKKHQMWFCGFP